jgi:hypothetical protein
MMMSMAETKGSTLLAEAGEIWLSCRRVSGLCGLQARARGFIRARVLKSGRANRVQRLGR